MADSVDEAPVAGGRTGHHEPGVGGGGGARPRSTRFGRIDVLVTNAGNFYAGFFEELTPDQVERSLTTNLVGPMNITPTGLP